MSFDDFNHGWWRCKVSVGLAGIQNGVKTTLGAPLRTGMLSFVSGGLRGLGVPAWWMSRNLQRQGDYRRRSGLLPEQLHPSVFEQALQKTSTRSRW